MRSAEAVAPPSARSSASRTRPSDSTASTTSTTCWATASSAARARWALVVPAVSPAMTPVAERSQYGAPSPEKAGTNAAPPLSSTCSASSVRKAPPAVPVGAPRAAAIQSSAAPLATMLPSRANVVRPPACQATVVAMPSGAGPSSASGVITDEPVPYVALPVPGSVQPWK